MKKLKFITGFIIVLFLASLCTGQEYNLKYQLKEGTNFIITFSNELEQTIDQMGTEVVSTVKTLMENGFTVKAVQGDKGLTFEIEFKNMENTAESMMGEASADLSELIGKKVTYSLSPTGEAGDFTGLEDLPEITLATQETLGGSLYKVLLESLFPKLPENAVKIGDTWTKKDENTVPMPGGEMKIVTDLTYNLIEEIKLDGNDCVKIDVKSKITTKGNFEQQGTPLALEMKGEGAETFYFAYKKGIFISRDGSDNSEGNVLVEAQGIELPIINKTKTKVSVKFVK